MLILATFSRQSLTVKKCAMSKHNRIVVSDARLSAVGMNEKH